MSQLKPHQSGITDITFSPNGHWIASSDSLGGIQLWPLDRDVWREQACRMANRELTQQEWAEYFPNQPQRTLCPNTRSTLGYDPYTGEPPDYIPLLPPLRPRSLGSMSLAIPRVSSNVRKPPDAPAAQNTRVRSNSNTVIAASSNACLDFDGSENWGSEAHGYLPWDDQYQGWAPFAVDDGLYGIENVVFAREESVRAGNYSFKISSIYPYAAGLSSPLIPVNQGDEITVTARYYIWNHGQDPQEWASLVVKTDVSSSLSDGTFHQWFT